VNDGGLLDLILANFTSAISGSWGPSLSLYLLPLLLALVTLQFGMIAIEATIARDVPLLLMHVMLGIIRIGIVVAIFQNTATWANDIVQTGQVIGVNIAGLSPGSLTPSGVFNTGNLISTTIYAAKASGGFLKELFQDIEFLIIGAVVTFAWMIASVLYLGALLEGVLLVYAGPLVVAFTPLSWTFDMLLIWGKSLLAIAFKIALTLMTLGVGMVLANQWTAAAAAAGPTFTTNIWNLLLAVVESVMFAWLVWKIPTKFSGLTGGAAVLGFGEAVISMGANAGAKTISSAAANSAGGRGSSGGGGGASAQANAGASGGGPGLASQAAHAVADAARQLASKVQAALMK
jgi:P-type conjugative transfer protein TrbL